MIDTAFWEYKKLEELTTNEWELLCDNCGYCCLVKLEDEDNGAIYTTNVACRLLDTKSCRCSDYQMRQAKVASCLVLSADKPERFKLLPDSCAYRCIYEGRKLPDWHPLISNDMDAASLAGVSVCAYAVSEEYVHPDQLQDHIIHQFR